MDPVAAELRRFDPALPLDRARTPPRSWYVDPAIHELERERVFRRGWLPVARADELAQPGAYVAGETAGAPWVVVRDPSGELRAFHNVCRHRATVLVTGRGRLEEGFTCPYHGWRYDLDGRLRSAPELGAVRGFERDAHGLAPVRVATRGPLVFVALQEPERDLARDIDPVADLLDEALDLRWVASRSYELDCNWKVYVDNFLDGGYHVAHLHRGLAGELSLDTYATDLFERCSIQHSRASDAGAERLGGGARYAFVHPSWMVNRYGPILDLNRVEPLGPARTRVVFDWWFEPGAADDEPFVERCLERSERIQLEDVDICARVQRGLGSPGYETGPYAARELAEHHFHRLLFADLTGGPRPTAG